MVKPDPKAYSTQFSGAEDEPQSQVGEAAGGDAPLSEDEKWGFTDKKGGMASETKLGIIIFAVIACGLGFYGWKTFGTAKPNQIAANEHEGESSEGPESTGSATPVPPGEDSDAIPSAFGGVTPASASDEDLFNVHSEPTGDEFAPAASESVAASGTGRVELNPDEFGGLMEPASDDPAEAAAAGAAARVAQPEAGLDAFGGTAELQPLEPADSAGGAQPLDDPWATAGTAQEDVFGAEPGATASAGVTAQTTGDPNDPWAAPAETGRVLARPEDSEAPAIAFDEGSPTPSRTTTDPLEADGFTFSPDRNEQPAAAPASTAQPPSVDPFAGDVSAGVDSTAIARSQPDPFQPTEPGSDGSTRAELATDSRIAPRAMPSGADSFDSATAATTERFGSRLSGRTVASEQQIPAFDVSTRSTMGSNNGSYEVRRGDTFWSISKAVYGTSRYYRSLARHNARVVPNPHHMPVGKVLSTPPASELESRFEESLPPVASTVNAKTFDARQPRGLYLDARDNLFYRVGRGDSLGTIAQLHLGRASRASDIQRLNRDQLPTSNAILRPGMLLAMPDDASSVNTVRR